MNAIDYAMKVAIERNADNPKIAAWLAKNPPPENWQGTAMEWAYTESPSWLWKRR